MRDALIRIRGSNNMTQEDVAKLVGISRSYYGHIETGARNPTYGLAKKIAKVFGVNVNDIFFDYDSYRLKQDKPPNREAS